jgi:hypothetical protein
LSLPRKTPLFSLPSVGETNKEHDCYRDHHGYVGWLTDLALVGGKRFRTNGKKLKLWHNF